MHKLIAIGDVHADFGLLWDALRAASCVDAQGRPTPPVLSGLYQVILIGDLVHPKSAEGYARLIGADSFDPHDETHLLQAAREQVRELERLRAYQEAAPHAVHIVLGNHDDAVLNPHFVLGTNGGLRHIEFDPERGGVMLPPQLHTWMSGFPRELRVGDVQFAHVSPLPAHLHYDDLFYADHSSKRWFRETPEYVQMAGLRFGVYGHTQPGGGILFHHDDAGELSFAMIDALQEREYLEVMYDAAEAGQLRSVCAVPF
ncbi:metallophosphoesterase [uncultured Deinococcus sp.]|uniref:metallophosphoesterase n=1 Tax=uncultured Deinococcus sp. TaxID=158789 RepID=UPI00374A1F83